MRRRRRRRATKKKKKNKQTKQTKQIIRRRTMITIRKRARAKTNHTNKNMGTTQQHTPMIPNRTTCTREPLTAHALRINARASDLRHIPSHDCRIYIYIEGDI